MSTLVIQSGKHRGKQILFPDQEQEFVVGRDEECFIRLSSSAVSRWHCVLRSSEQGIVVEDLGSSNGTFVNGVRIATPTLLRPGDSLRIGVAEFAVPGTRRMEPDRVREEEIVEWLSDGDTATGPPDGGTAVINIPEQLKQAPEPAPAPRRSDPEQPVAAYKSKPANRARKEFRSIAEEARYIIERHFELTRGGEGRG